MQPSARADDDDGVSTTAFQRSLLLYNAESKRNIRVSRQSLAVHRLENATGPL
jgi:hypothetical protein